MARAFLVGRVLVGGFYLREAFHQFMDLGHLSRAAAARGMPAAELVMLVGGVLLLVAGLSFLLGLFPRLGVCALALFLVPVALVMHSFWAVGLLGSALMFLAVPRPWPYSVERRLRLPVRAPV